jgi:hypothetical protein
MDFFDIHPYTFDVQELQEIATFYGTSRPLTFTEWGGKEIGQSEQVMPHTVDMLIDLGKSGRLAGSAFWSWQDLPQFSRIDAEMSNGILESGVVTEARETRPQIAMELRRLFAGESRVRPRVKPELLPLRHAPWTAGKQISPIDLQSTVETEEQRAAWKELETLLASYWRTQSYTSHY